MATQNPISSISYNSESFLREKLDSWVKAHIIQCYMYILHIGEDGDKNHIHFRIEPNKRIDPMDLTEALQEFDSSHPTKPLGIRPWRPSKEEDWFLYAVHDKQYLDLKYGGGEKGEKLPYNFHDIRVSDFYDLEVAWTRAKAYLEHSTVNLATRLQEGEQPSSLLFEGVNPFSLNAIVKALSENDYSRLASEHRKVSRDYNRLRSAVFSAGFLIEVSADDGSFSLVKCPEGINPESGEVIGGVSD